MAKRKPVTFFVGGEELGDQTPSNIMLTIYSHEFEALKEHVATNHMSLRAYFAAAYEAMSARRAKWDSSKRFPWRASPQVNSENDDVVQINVFLSVREDMSLRVWAEVDCLTINDAAYTAAMLHMVE